jgi:type IV secretory pathway ATPase VirB11/archaellum biosynthesis ATPase
LTKFIVHVSEVWMQDYEIEAASNEETLALVVNTARFSHRPVISGNPYSLDCRRYHLR